LSHPDSLNQIKPGYYVQNQSQNTQDKSAFPEVRRIYTGGLVCFNVGALSHRLTIQDNPDTVTSKYTV